LADPQRAWLVVAMGSTLAGNFTLVGSVANLIVAERARREGVLPTRAKADSFGGFQTSASLTPWWRTGGLPCGQGLSFAATMTPPGFGA